MRRAASQLSLSCGPGSGAHPGVRPALCVDCRLALPHAALGLIVIRSVLSRPGLCARRNTSGRWFPAPALELAGVPPLDGMAILAGRSRPRNLASLNWRDVALPARLVEAVDRRFAPGSGGAALFFILGARKKLDAEGWAFLLIMPGLAEELVFRGVFQSLLNRVFGKPWRLAGAEFGWGLIVTAILFAGFNGLVAVDSHLNARIVLHAAIAPFLMSLVSGWVRERTDSVWPCVFGHNLSNIVIPFASLFA